MEVGNSDVRGWGFLCKVIALRLFHLFINSNCINSLITQFFFQPVNICKMYTVALVLRSLEPPDLDRLFSSRVTL